MCGIVGCYQAKGFEQISNNINLIAHRGPDARSVIETPRGTLGHTRLAILDVSGGHQPMTEQDRLIVFNGEIYNFLELRDRYISDASTESDTEVVLKLYREFGPRVVEMLDGMFALAILDQDELFLARDPIGIKPLYYAVNKGQVWFASEAKALIGQVKGIKEFPAGHWWHSHQGMNQYYDFNAVGKKSNGKNGRPDMRDFQIIQETLRGATHKRMIADEEVPVGVSLSGGLDSSIIAALAHEVKSDLDTFAVGTTGGTDVPASQRVADHLGTRHHIYQYDFQEMLDSLPEVIYHLESFDAPLVRSAIPNYFLARLASDHVKVMLTGEGADELFAGYEYLSHYQDAEDLEIELRRITNNLHNINLQRTDRMSMAHSIEGRVPFLDTEMIDLAFNAPSEWKLHRQEQPEKALLRNSFTELLPKEIIKRKKAKFSDGAGSMEFLAHHAEEVISDEEYMQFQEENPDDLVRSKEELFYYYIFREQYGEHLDPDVAGKSLLDM